MAIGRSKDLAVIAAAASAERGLKINGVKSTHDALIASLRDEQDNILGVVEYATVVTFDDPEEGVYCRRRTVKVNGARVCGNARLIKTASPCSPLPLLLPAICTALPWTVWEIKSNPFLTDRTSCGRKVGNTTDN